MKNYFVTLEDSEFCIRVNSHYYARGKFEGAPENCYPDESELDWDVVDEDGNIDPVTYDEFSDVQVDDIERQLWEQLEREYEDD